MAMNPGEHYRDIQQRPVVLTSADGEAVAYKMAAEKLAEPIDWQTRLRIEEAIWHSTYGNMPMPDEKPSSDRYWLNVTAEAVIRVFEERWRL